MNRPGLIDSKLSLDEKAMTEDCRFHDHPELSALHRTDGPCEEHGTVLRHDYRALSFRRSFTHRSVGQDRGEGTIEDPLLRQGGRGGLLLPRSRQAETRPQIPVIIGYIDKVRWGRL